MSKGILIGANPQLLETFSLNLKMYVDIECMTMKSHAEAVKLMDLIGKVDILITESKIGTEQAGMAIQQYFDVKGWSVPLIILGEDPNIYKSAVILGRDYQLKDVVRACAKALGVTAKDMASKSVNDYYEIPVSTLDFIPELMCDVFIKQKKGVEQFDYLRCFKAKETPGEEQLLSIKEQGIEKLWIPSSYRLKFCDLTTQVVLAIFESEKSTEEQKLKAAQGGQASVAQEINSDGLTPNVVKLSNACMKGISNLIESTPQLQKLLKNLLKMKATYVFKHCSLINYASFYLNDKIDWGSKEQQEKLAFVSFFHDIALSAPGLDSERLTRIDNVQDLRKMTESDREREAVERHALHAAMLVKNFPRAPLGCDIIIQQHHGAINGVGIPERLSLNISPLGILFIIAESFANEVLKYNDVRGVNINRVTTKLLDTFKRRKEVELVEYLKGIKF